MGILSKLIYRFEVIHIKIKASFPAEQTNTKIHMEMPGTQTIQNNQYSFKIMLCEDVFYVNY